MKSPPNLLVPALLAATLGLAPFTPEPHIVGKVRWVMGGGVGMGAMDWFDLALHGAPFVLLAVQLVRYALWYRGRGPAAGPPPGARP